MPVAVATIVAHGGNMLRTRTTRLVIDSDRALPIHIDGELFAPYEANVRHVEIEVVPGAVQVLT